MWFLFFKTINMWFLRSYPQNSKLSICGFSTINMWFLTINMWFLENCG